MVPTHAPFSPPFMNCHAPLILAGPTAVGKTDLVMQVCRATGAEVISMDSMQIYRGMDIGTAKPDRHIRREIPHHLIDIADPDQPFTVKDFLERALEKIASLHTRGRLPLVTGGTFLYLKALLYGLFEHPSHDPEIRRELTMLARQHGKAHLHQQLCRVDPEAGSRIHAEDLKRVVRALEVYRTTGKPLSALQEQWKRERKKLACTLVFVTRPIAEIHQRISRRVEDMIENGLVEEVRRLRGRLSRQTEKAVGYQEILRYLAGQTTLDKAIDAIKLHTRQFAKHQRTWMRGFTADRMMDLSRERNPAETIIKLAQGMSA